MRSLPEILGESEEVLDMLSNVNRVAGIDRPVLILGDRGTGKELVASRLHYLSARWEMPLVTLNCGAITESLVETELFGYEAGAFTGAAKRKAGRFEVADGGTIFLDEIGLMPLNVQEKLLRILEYGVFFRVGGMDEVQVDVRVIGATHADIKSLVELGKFKADLLDRLAFEVIEVPPLRCRGDDLVLLSQHFLMRMSVELGLAESPGLSDEALRLLRNHSWPGNVRELKNVIERAVSRDPDNLLNGLVFDPFEKRWPVAGVENTPEPASAPAANHDGNKVQELSSAVSVDGTFSERVTAFETGLICGALDANGGHRGRAAETLGLTYHQLRALMRKYADHPKLQKFTEN